MTEYLINDDWVLHRISKNSNSFNDWLNGIISSVESQIEENLVDKTELEQVKKDLPQLVDIENQFNLAKSKLSNLKETLPGLGSLGSILSSFSNILGEKISTGIKKQSQNIPGMDNLDIDFIMGKRKSLSEALFDVAKERGIKSEGILYLIKSLPDLESFLYSTSAGKFYRDHTEHQLRVAVLGDFLLEQDFGSGNLLNHIADITEFNKNELKNKIWWIMGLIHDIGYPLQKMTKSINYSLLNQILKCYPMLDIEVSPFEINLTQQNSNQMDYLTFIEEGLSKEAKILIRNGAGYNISPLPNSEIQHFINNGKEHQKYEHKSSVNLDHGVVGALALLKSLGTTQEIEDNKEGYKGFIKAAQAIALHNFKDRLPEFTFENHPFAFLLVLIDELQEWGRPIPLQIRDSYFTTELNKITLLDEIQLLIDEVEWLMIYKNKKAKELVNFQFPVFCNSKFDAFERLNRGKEFPKTRIVLQDVEPRDIRSSSIHIDQEGISKLIADTIAKSNQEEEGSEVLKENLRKQILEEEFGKKNIDKKQSHKIKETLPESADQEKEKLVAEYYIVI
ncbi:MAG: hypothetical protein ACFFDW_11670 [Candidatus Thorarchaeota archaeon]